MVVAIDGPAGAGKSTIARTLSKKTGMFYLNSGNFYRAITFELLRKGKNPENEADLIETARGCRFSIRREHLYLNGEDVEDFLHTDQVDAWVAQHSAVVKVRRIVNESIRGIAQGMDIIIEGRDITTVVFPDAEVKVYLDANEETRAKRRFDQGVSTLDFQEILKNIKMRDQIDKNKPEGSLRVSPESLFIDTSGLTIDEVCEKVLAKIRRSKK